MTWVSSASKPTHMFAGKIQFKEGCLTEDLSSSLAVIWSPPSVLCHVGLSMGQITRHLLASFRASEREEARWKPQSFYNLISEMAFHYSCCILLVRGKTISPAHIEGKGITKVYEYQKAGITGDIPRCCLTPLCIFKAKRYKDTDYTGLITGWNDNYSSFMKIFTSMVLKEF